jgi:L-seryl-tRNA(Ser) seleniumtransferase
VSLPAAFAEPLRLGRTPVVGYLEDDRTLLNLRSLLPADDDALADAVLEVAAGWT